LAALNAFTVRSSERAGLCGSPGLPPTALAVPVPIWLLAHLAGIVVWPSMSALVHVDGKYFPFVD